MNLPLTPPALFISDAAISTARRCDRPTRPLSPVKANTNPNLIGFSTVLPGGGAGAVAFAPGGGVAPPAGACVPVLEGPPTGVFVGPIPHAESSIASATNAQMNPNRIRLNII